MHSNMIDYDRLLMDMVCVRMIIILSFSQFSSRQRAQSTRPDIGPVGSLQIRPSFFACARHEGRAGSNSFDHYSVIDSLVDCAGETWHSCGSNSQPLRYLTSSGLDSRLISLLLSSLKQVDHTYERQMTPRPGSSIIISSEIGIGQVSPRHSWP